MPFLTIINSFAEHFQRTYATWVIKEFTTNDIKKEFHNLFDRKELKDVKIVFIFDEAKSLMRHDTLRPNFLELRRALRCLPRK